MSYCVAMARGHIADGRLIRVTRITRGLSLAQAAQKIGMNKSNLAKIERGEQGITDLVAHKVSVLLELDVESIIPALAAPREPQ